MWRKWLTNKGRLRWSIDAGCQSLAHDIVRVICQFQRWQFIARKPANIGRIAACFEVAADCATQEINQHIVIPHSFRVVSDHTLIYAQHFAGLDQQSRFLAGFTRHRFAQSFHRIRGRRPAATTRPAAAAVLGGLAGAVVLDDHRANAHQRIVRIFATHLSKPLFPQGLKPAFYRRWAAGLNGLRKKSELDAQALKGRLILKNLRYR